MKRILNQRFTSLDREKIYIVGVSGGPDSMFLLDKMRKLKYKLAVAHVNYEKRKDSYTDESIVKQYCSDHQISFFLKKPDYSKVKNGNFQSFARIFRYNFFSHLCEEFSSNNHKTAIVIAHNLEDLIETYYIQKKRNSSVNFWGLPFRSSWGKFDVYRPILSFSKLNILAYLEKGNIKYAIDYTNDKEIYLRNFLRKKIMPMPLEEKVKILKEINDLNNILSKDLNHLKNIYKEIIFGANLVLNDSWHSLNFELKKRVVYSWINSFSKNSFLSRKKNTITEVVKQFDSSSETLALNFKNGFKIEKHKSLALISKVV